MNSIMFERCKREREIIDNTRIENKMEKTARSARAKMPKRE